MNQNVYETLNEARKKLFDIQTSYAAKDDVLRLELDIVAMAVDDSLDELDRLGKRIRELESGGK